MKALVLTATKKMEIQDIDQPTVKPNEVKIQTKYDGVCGTDHALYNGLPGSADAVPPIVLGHENSGVVAEVGSEVTNVKVGDRVTVDPNIYCANVSIATRIVQNSVRTFQPLVLLVMVALKNTSPLLQLLFTQFLMTFHLKLPQPLNPSHVLFTVSNY